MPTSEVKDLRISPHFSCQHSWASIICLPNLPDPILKPPLLSEVHHRKTKSNQIKSNSRWGRGGRRRRREEESGFRRERVRDEPKFCRWRFAGALFRSPFTTTRFAVPIGLGSAKINNPSTQQPSSYKHRVLWLLTLTRSSHLDPSLRSAR